MRGIFLLPDAWEEYKTEATLKQHRSAFIIFWACVSSGDSVSSLPV